MTSRADALYDQARPYLAALADGRRREASAQSFADDIVAAVAPYLASSEGRSLLRTHVLRYLGERLLDGDAARGGRSSTPDDSAHDLVNLGLLYSERLPEIEQEAEDRRLIEQLIADTRLYDTREDVEELLGFLSRLREFAPFNAMLLHIQKPGLTHAATRRDWLERFGRRPKRDARPLVVMRAMGPVDFVFDVLDTEGEPLPEDTFAFPVLGDLDEGRFQQIVAAVRSEGFQVEAFDKGDSSAGRAELTHVSKKPRGKNRYRLSYNRNHSPAESLTTLAHELAHVLLGHLGEDRGRGVKDRTDRSHALQEVEAETTAYIVARRNGLKPRSESYLASYKGALTNLDWHAMTKAANAVETAFGVSSSRIWQDESPAR